MLVPNTPLKRMEYIAKQYGATAPEVVLDTFIIMSDTVGIENISMMPDEPIEGLYGQGKANPFSLWYRISTGVEYDRADEVRMIILSIGADETLGSKAAYLFRASERVRYDNLTKEAILRAGMNSIRKVDNMRQGTETDAVWVWVATQLFKLRKEAVKAYITSVDAMERYRSEPLHAGPPRVYPSRRYALKREYDAAFANAQRTVSEYNHAMAMLRQKGSALALWQRKRNINLNNYDYMSALKELRKFADEEKTVEPGEIIYRWEDGWTIQRLDTDKQLESEGEAMQNCVGTYCDDVSAGALQILSLRDQKSRPHVSIEYLPQYKAAVQIRGKQNEPPVDKYWARVDEFFEDAGICDLESLAEAVGENLVMEGEIRPGFPKEDLTEFVDLFYADGQIVGEWTYNEWIKDGWRPSRDHNYVDVRYVLRELASGQDDDVFLRRLGVPTQVMLSDKYEDLAHPFIKRMEDGADDMVKMLADRDEERIEEAIQHAYEKATEEATTMEEAESIVSEVLSLTNANEADYENAMGMVRERGLFYEEEDDWEEDDDEEDDSWD